MILQKRTFYRGGLKKIEKKMSEIIDRDVKTREVWKRNDAIKHFKNWGKIQS